MKVERFTGEGQFAEDEQYFFHCPGCKVGHQFNTRRSKATMEFNTKHGLGNPLWKFNGDVNNPTFHPSLLYQWEEGDAKVKKVCHLFLRNGVLEFLNDCTHELAGQKFNLPDEPDLFI